MDGAHDQHKATAPRHEFKVSRLADGHHPEPRECRGRGPPEIRGSVRATRLRPDHSHYLAPLSERRNKRRWAGGGAASPANQLHPERLRKGVDV
jgi:hypothetical protein